MSFYSSLVNKLDQNKKYWAVQTPAKAVACFELDESPVLLVGPQPEPQNLNVTDFILYMFYYIYS